MTATKKPEPIIISENDARGAEGPEDVTRGDTLLPMLIIGVVLTVLGLAVIATFIR